MTLLKSAGAVVAGVATMMGLVVVGTFAAVAALSTPGAGPSGPYLVANLLVSVAGAVAGGAVVAWLAPCRPRLHTAVVAAVMVLLAVPGLRDAAAGAGAGGRPAYYAPVVLLVGLAGLAAGALLVERRGGASASS